MKPILINLDISFPAFETGVEFLSLVLQRSPPETMNRQSGVYFSSPLWILFLKDYKSVFSQNFIAKNWTTPRLSSLHSMEF